MTDSARRAYATLGLPFGASQAQVKRRYRLLVKRWHPDRFAADPVGQAEAGERLAHINTAYHVLIERPDSTPHTPPPSYERVEPPPRTPPSHRLSREQIDAMVEAIGNQSPLDWMLGWFERLAYPSSNIELRGASPTAIALWIIGGIAMIAVHIRYGHWAADAVALGIVAILLLASRITRRL
jgi:DnaJ domain